MLLANTVDTFIPSSTHMRGGDIWCQTAMLWDDPWETHSEASVEAILHDRDELSVTEMPIAIIVKQLEDNVDQSFVETLTSACLHCPVEHIYNTDHPVTISVQYTWVTSDHGCWVYTMDLCTRMISVNKWLKDRHTWMTSVHERPMHRNDWRPWINRVHELTVYTNDHSFM